MKRILLLILCFSLLFSFAACRSSESTGQYDTKIAPNPEESGNPTLIVYFSATGNTEKAAEIIASATDGELFELIPTEPYTAEDLNWNDENSRVVREYNHPEERETALTTETVEDWNAYETIFIGYPIWWGIAAWPVNSFIEANDFTGKTVIPFCTSASSELGESGELLREAAGSGRWLPGKRLSSNPSESEIEEWLDTLEL